MRCNQIVTTLLLLGAVLVGLRQFEKKKSPSAETLHHASHSTGADVSPVCPWREPARDLLTLFPQATNFVVEPRILSRMTVEIEKRLGRRMTTDENPLRLHRVQQDHRWLGTVLVTRIKAEHGGVEFVVGVETNGAVRGVLIQSQREPETVAAIITGSNFLSAFTGKSATSPLRLGEDLPGVPPEALRSAQAVADGVRDQLLVLSYAELPREVRELGLPAKR